MIIDRSFFCSNCEHEKPVSAEKGDFEKMKRGNSMRKRRLMITMLLLFCLGQVFAGPCGDVNTSGNVDIVDALLIAQYYVGLNPSSFDISVADTNGDGSVTIVDGLLIAQLYVGLISQLSCPNVTAVPTATPAVTPVPNTTTVIMPLGDSITDGFNVPGGYRIKLWASIQGIGAKIDFVGSMSNGPAELTDKNHEGHSGWQISQIDSNINAWMDTYKPKIVLLHIGTNDINMNTDLANAPARLSALIDKICAKLAAGGKVYVATLVPLSGQDAKINAYNSAIPGVVQAKVGAGKPVYLVSMSSVTLGDLADGVHPNRTGYDKMADNWFAAIRNDL